MEVGHGIAVSRDEEARALPGDELLARALPHVRHIAACRTGGRTAACRSLSPNCCCCIPRPADGLIVLLDLHPHRDHRGLHLLDQIGKAGLRLHGTRRHAPACRRASPADSAGSGQNDAPHRSRRPMRAERRGASIEARALWRAIGLSWVSLHHALRRATRRSLRQRTMWGSHAYGALTAGLILVHAARMPRIARANAQIVAARIAHGQTRVVLRRSAGAASPQGRSIEASPISEPCR